jgi:hypothetical protein
VPGVLEDVVGCSDRAHRQGQAGEEGQGQVSDEEIDAWLDGKTPHELMRLLALSTLYTEWRK